jgi:hypothetical protein
MNTAALARQTEEPTTETKIAAIAGDALALSVEWAKADPLLMQTASGVGRDDAIRYTLGAAVKLMRAGGYHGLMADLIEACVAGHKAAIRSAWGHDCNSALESCADEIADLAEAIAHDLRDQMHEVAE